MKMDGGSFVVLLLLLSATLSLFAAGEKTSPDEAKGNAAAISGIVVDEQGSAIEGADVTYSLRTSPCCRTMAVK